MLDSNDKYMHHATFWSRLEKKIQSDFICRPQALELAGDVTQRKIVDVGCGDGYVSRLLANADARVVGIDISQTLIKLAQLTEFELNQGIQYHIADATKPLTHIVPAKSQNLAFSICVAPHLSYVEMTMMLRNISTILKDDGQLIFAVPHPKIFRDKNQSNWITFEYETFPQGCDKFVPIKLYTGSGESFPVLANPHSTAEFQKSFEESGFTIDKLVEPLATASDLAIFPERWGDESKVPFYQVYKLHKITYCVDGKRK